MEATATFVAIFAAIFVAVFLPLFLLSGERSRAAQESVRARRIAEARMNARLLVSGGDSLASNKAGAFLPWVPCVPVQCAAFGFPVSW
jgi:hypothetical protein